MQVEDKVAKCKYQNTTVGGGIKVPPTENYKITLQHCDSITNLCDSKISNAIWIHIERFCLIGSIYTMNNG